MGKNKLFQSVLVLCDSNDAHQWVWLQAKLDFRNFHFSRRLTLKNIRHTVSLFLNGFSNNPFIGELNAKIFMSPLSVPNSNILLPHAFCVDNYYASNDRAHKSMDEKLIRRSNLASIGGYCLLLLNMLGKALVYNKRWCKKEKGNEEREIASS